MCRHNNNKRNRSEDLEHLEIQLALARIEDKIDELEEKLSFAGNLKVETI